MDCPVKPDNGAEVWRQKYTAILRLDRGIHEAVRRRQPGLVLVQPGDETGRIPAVATHGLHFGVIAVDDFSHRNI